MSHEPLTRRLASKGLANVLGTAAVVAQGLVVSLLAARLLPREAFARLVYLNWAAGTLAVLALAGLPAVLMRYVPEALGRSKPGEARRVVLASVLAGAFALGLVSLAVLIIDPRLGLLGLAPFTLLVLAAAWAQGFQQIASATAQATGRNQLVARTSALAAPLAIAAIWLGLSRGGGVAWVLTVGLSLAAAQAAVWLAMAMPGGDGAATPPWTRLRRYFAYTSGIVLMDQVVWQRSELFFLARWAKPGDVALYGVAFNVASAVVRMAPVALAGVFTPAFAYLAARPESGERDHLYREAARAQALVTGALLVVSLGAAPALLRLWGLDFVAAWPLVAILALGLGSANVSGVASARLHGEDRADVLLKGGLVLAITNLVLDLVLIPHYGAVGAAVACAGAQLLAVPLLFSWTRRALGAAIPVREMALALAPLAIGGVAALAIAGAISTAIVAGIVASLVGLALFLVSCRALGLWRDQDRTRLAALCEELPGGPWLARHLFGTPAPTPVAGPAPKAGTVAVSIVVPTKNRPDFLARCLTQVSAEQGPAREIIVVDSSDDEASQQVLDRFPEVLRVRIRGGRNNRHLAKNAGVAVARGAIVCFLDDDSFVQPGWLARLTRHYSDATVGAVGGRIIDRNFARSDGAGDIGKLLANGRLTLNFTVHPGRVLDVDHCIGCNLSFRVAAFRAVGGFDVHYGGPNLLEETDLCLRVKRAGNRVLFDPEAVVEHVNAPRDTGMKREALDPRLEFWSARSRAYFVLKLLPRSWPVLRYNVVSFLAQHARAAIDGPSFGHARAFVLQSAGLSLGAWDWLRAGLPRVAPPKST